MPVVAEVPAVDPEAATPVSGPEPGERDALLDAERRQPGEGVVLFSVQRQWMAMLFLSLATLCSVGLILYNKWLLTDGDFPYPMLLTFQHMVLSSIFSYALMRVGYVKLFPTPLTLKVVAQTIFPVAVVTSVSHLAGNYGFLYLSVALMQMIKKGGIACTLLFSFMAGIERPSWPKFGTAMVITAGVCLTIVGDVEMQMLAVAVGLVGMFSNSLKLVLSKHVMTARGLNLNGLQMLLVFAPACAITNGVLFLCFELRTISWSTIWTVEMSAHLLANGILAFLLNVFTFLALQYSSAYPVALAGVVKDIFLIMSSCLIWGTHISWLQYLGYTIAVVGMLAHKFIVPGVEEKLGKKRRLLGGRLPASKGFGASNAKTVEMGGSDAADAYAIKGE